MEFVKENAPHIHRKDSLFRMMLDVIIALLPVIVMSFVYYPLAALRNILVSVAVMVFSEMCFVMIMNKAKLKDGEKYQPLKGYTREHVIVPIVSALIFALIMPVATDKPVYAYLALVTGALFGLIIGKLVFGGTGKNIFNPAAVGMVFAKVCFGSHFQYPGSSTIAFDGYTGATALSGAEANGLISIGSFSINPNFSLLDMFLGKTGGVLGETCKIAILIGLVYLIIRHTIDWKIPLIYIGTFAVMMCLAGLIIHAGHPELSTLYFVGYEVLSGGLLFGAVFMATDPVTSPMSNPARINYAIFLGVVTALIRLFGSLPEGVVYTILMGNMVTPLFDYYKWGYNKWSWKKGLACTLTFLVPALIVIWAMCVEVL